MEKSIKKVDEQENILGVDYNLEELQKIFQEGITQFKIQDKRNVFVQCNITKDEVNRGCMKKIKYNRINENGKKELKEIFVKIPEGIKKGQSIIIYGEGNYIEKLSKNSNLVVKIKLK